MQTLYEWIETGVEVKRKTMSEGHFFGKPNDMA
jgi:hypothetical protein